MKLERGKKKTFKQRVRDTFSSAYKNHLTVERAGSLNPFSGTASRLSLYAEGVAEHHCKLSLKYFFL